MNKLSEYVQVAEAADIAGVSHNIVRTWAGDGNITVHHNPADGDRLFNRTALKDILRETAESTGKEMQKAR